MKSSLLGSLVGSPEVRDGTPDSLNLCLDDRHVDHPREGDSLEIKYHGKTRVIEYDVWTMAYLNPRKIRFSIEKRKAIFSVIVLSYNEVISSSSQRRWFGWPSIRSEVIDFCLVPLIRKGAELKYSPIKHKGNSTGKPLGFEDIKNIRESMHLPLERGEFNFEQLAKRNSKF